MPAPLLAFLQAPKAQFARGPSYGPKGQESIAQAFPALAWVPQKKRVSPVGTRENEIR
jgi:hypothetical protein